MYKDYLSPDLSINRSDLVDIALGMSKRSEACPACCFVLSWLNYHTQMRQKNNINRIAVIKYHIR